MNSAERVLIGAMGALVIASGVATYIDNAGSEFTGQINQSLNQGNEVDIVEGKFQVGRDINRRQWDQVLYFTRDLHTNVSYSDKTETVENPLVRPFDPSEPTNRSNDGVGWLVYYRPNDAQAVAVLVDHNTQPSIHALGTDKNIGDIVANLRRRVLIEDVSQEKTNGGTRPVASYTDQLGSRQRVAYANWTR